MRDLANKLSGKAKEIAGRLTNNRKLEAKGRFQRDMANVRQKTRDTWDRLDDKF